ncbi:MAG TPA: cytochrome c maturation protein CcmE [Saprospiraceae bacterium]|nr:cytochrome c maturation protein CcmE [Saprospiraceae bacterium]
MKRSYVIAGMALIAGIFLIISASKDSSTYSNFSDADRSDNKVKVIGQLVKDKEMVYDPEVDPNYFSFFVKDNSGEERKVVLLQEKPQDFELSEQIVMTGKMQGEEFLATDLLLKCPSKYKDEEVAIKGIEES